MVHGKKRISYWIDRRLTGLAGPDYDATLLFGLPFEPEDSQYGKYRLRIGSSLTLPRVSATSWVVSSKRGRPVHASLWLTTQGRLVAEEAYAARRLL